MEEFIISLDKVIAFLESEQQECPEPWLREGLAEIKKLRDDGFALQQENNALYSGIAACVLSTGKEELFIPDSILTVSGELEIIRDAEKAGYNVKVRSE